MDEWIKLISQAGFPIMVSVYLLLKLETTIKELTNQVINLKLALAKKGLEVIEEGDPHKA